MKKVEVNVYEAVPILVNILNLSGFTKLFLHKSERWLPNKFKKITFGNVQPGFDQKDVELLNNAVLQTSEFIRTLKIKGVESCSDRDIYNTYVGSRLNETRKILSLKYLCEISLSISYRTFAQKIRNDKNRNGKPRQFTEEEICYINKGLDQISSYFDSLVIVL